MATANTMALERIRTLYNRFKRYRWYMGSLHTK